MEGDRVHRQWSAAEDALVRELCLDKNISGLEAWREIAGRFPGRSVYAVRQRLLTLRMLADGTKRPRQPKLARAAKGRRRRSKLDVEPTLSVQPPRPTSPAPVNLTAWVFGDPLPGRSALDQKRGMPA